MTIEGIIQAEKHGYLEVYQLGIESMEWKLNQELPWIAGQD